MRCVIVSQGLHLQNRSLSVMVRPLGILDDTVKWVVWCMLCTRPDICWVVTKLPQFLIARMKGHWIALKHVLRYLKGTLDFELCYRKCYDGLILIGYSDADWASSTDDRRSFIM